MRLHKEEWSQHHENLANEVEQIARTIRRKYPTLIFKKIEVGFTATTYTMVASARLDRNGQRIYTLDIGNGEHNQVYFGELSIEMKFGLIAHELSHLMQYERLGNLRLILFGLRYRFSKRFRKAMERDADTEAIRRGFRHHLAAFVSYCENHPYTSPKYKKMKSESYLSSSEILGLVIEESRPFVIPKEYASKN